MKEKDRGSWPGVWLPLRLLEGRELLAVVVDVVNQVKRVAHVLEAHARPTSETQPPDVAGPQ